MKRSITDKPEVRATLLATQWAQKIGLAVGNAWQPAVERNILREWRELGADDNAWAFIEAKYRIQLGLDLQ